MVADGATEGASRQDVHHFCNPSVCEFTMARCSNVRALLPMPFVMCGDRGKVQEATTHFLSVFRVFENSNLFGSGVFKELLGAP